MGISQKIQAVMTGEETAGPFLRLLLSFLEMLYGIAVNSRNILYDREILTIRTLPCRVISVGNLTVGGTGKTPMTIYLARILKELGYKTAVISRGYKGKAEGGSAVVSDGEKMISTPDIAGDEPYMMAKNLRGIPVLVGADRFQVGMKAMLKFSPDVIVFDDAFQHRRLKRDMDIVLIDDRSFLGNRHLLPLGILREPEKAVARADLLVLTRCSDSGTSRSLGTLVEMAPGKPVFRSSHEPYVYGIHKGRHFCGGDDGAFFDDSRTIGLLKAASVFVFSGIAKNGEFLKTVAALSREVVGTLAFNDHHGYTETDFYTIAEKAKNCCADFIVTTEKDYVKIAGEINFPVDLVVLGVHMSLGPDENQFFQLIREKVLQIQY